MYVVYHLFNHLGIHVKGYGAASLVRYIYIYIYIRFLRKTNTLLLIIYICVYMHTYVYVSICIYTALQKFGITLASWSTRGNTATQMTISSRI